MACMHGVHDGLLLHFGGVWNTGSFVWGRPGVSHGFPEGVRGSTVFVWFHGVFPPGHNALDGVVFG